MAMPAPSQYLICVASTTTRLGFWRRTASRLFSHTEPTVCASSHPDTRNVRMWSCSVASTEADLVTSRAFTTGCNRRVRGSANHAGVVTRLRWRGQSGFHVHGLNALLAFLHRTPIFYSHPSPR